MPRSTIWSLAVLLLLAACLEPPDPDAAARTATPIIVTTPSIENVNFVARHGGTCDVVGPFGGTWFPTQDEVTPCPVGATDCLEKVEIDTSVYPDAVCNDGTPAVMYVRTNPVSTHWIIHWQKGGDCGSYDACYQRWCGLDSYSASKMSTAHTPDAMKAEGIFADDPSNYFRSWNVVYGYYCSSDSWRGRAGPVALGGVVVGPSGQVSLESMSVRFNGYAIADAIVATLRTGAVVETGDGGDLDLPDLDLADQVVFSGGSAGGIGLRHLVDRFAFILRVPNSDLDVRAVFDSTHKPLEAFVTDAVDGTCDSSTADFADGVAALDAQAAASDALIDAVTDSSCLAAHPSDPERCANGEHVLGFHVTTPFFARQGLLEKLGDDDDDGVPDVDGELWKDAARDLIQAYDDVGRTDPVTGEVREPTLGEPGWFAPDCSTHTAIDTPRFYDETITATDGFVYGYEEALSNWIGGVGRRKLTQHDGAPVIDDLGYDRRSVCPHDDNDRMPDCTP